ncbi:MAG: hypothetical protein EOM04_07630 [Clostridia bacterium]|nr:hypothetical protein [Clostridia bacterium]
MESNIWEVIEKNKKYLSEKILLHQYSQEEVTADGIPFEYKSKYLQDSAYNLTFLSSALSFKSLNSYKKYMKWLSELMQGLGVPLDVMVKHFQSMEYVLSSEYKEYNLDELKTYINEGLKVFEKTWVENENISEIDNHNPEVDLFVEYIINFQREKATEYIMKLLEEGTDIKKIYMEIFQPSLYQIGILWQKHKITVAKEHYATSVIQSIIGMMYPYLFKNVNKIGKTFIGACSGGELHEIGLRMTADFFEMDGWDTHYLGANLPVEYVLEEIKLNKPDVLGISTTILPNLPYAKELIEKVRKTPEISKIIIIVGGRVYKDNENLWKEVGADAYVADALSAIEEANRLTLGAGK